LRRILSDPVQFQIRILGITPHAKQFEALKSEAKHRIICAGRRSGKSKMIAGEILRGMYFFYDKQILIAPTYKQSKIIYNEILIRLLESKRSNDILRASEHPYPQIMLLNKNYVDFASADNPDSLRGFDYGRLFIDEAGLITEKGWHAIRPLAFDTGAPTWKTGTPGGKNEFYYDYQRGLKGDNVDIASFHFSSFDNPFIDHEAVQAEVDEYGESSVYVQTEIFGNFVEGVDLLFPAELVRGCVDEAYELYTVV